MEILEIILTLITQVITIAAIFLGPWYALDRARQLNDEKETRGRKLDIFKSLMATRSYIISWQHVEALNQIDLEFDKNNPKEKEVLEAWREYRDCLGDTTIPREQWGVKRIELLIELLYKMAKSLGYDFDKPHIKNYSYAPIEHGNDEEEQRVLRQGFIRALRGDCALHMAIKRLPKNEKGNQNKQGG